MFKQGIGFTKLRTLTRFILENAEKFEWSLQGLGMLRLYLPNNTRLHVWDTRFAFPGASPIHDHLQWGLHSTVISGRLTNYRFKEYRADEGLGAPYRCMTLKAGFNCFVKEEARDTYLGRLDAEVYNPGDSYAQEPNEIHETVPMNGTVTIMQKAPTLDAESARVFWPRGQEWGSAEPRNATPEEVIAITSNALAILIDPPSV